MSTALPRNRRVLIVDDNEDIHADFRRILEPAAKSPVHTELDELEASILGAAPSAPAPPTFELTSAYQGAEALKKVQHAVKAGTPYALAFVDVRMPPGWDGVETLARLWQEDPGLQAVICSAYSDYTWEEITSRLGQTDRLLILRKPFDAVEVRQLACAMVARWRSEATLRGLLHMLPDALLRVTADGTCVHLQTSQECPAPLMPAFAPGSPLSTVFPKDVAPQLLDHLRQALKECSTRVFEYRHLVNGEARRIEARIVAIDSAEALILLRDRTETS